MSKNHSNFHAIMAFVISLLKNLASARTELWYYGARKLCRARRFGIAGWVATVTASVLFFFYFTFRIAA